MKKRWMIFSSLFLLSLVWADMASAQNGLTPEQQQYFTLVRALNTYPEYGDKGLKTVEDWLKKNQKQIADKANYQFLWAQVYACKRDWAQMEAAFRRGIEMGGGDSYTFASSVKESMTRAAAPDGNREKNFERTKTLEPPVPAELQKPFDVVIEAALDKWKDDQAILKLRARLPKS